MDLTEKSSRQSLIPSFLYGSSSAKTFGLEQMLHASPSAAFNTNVEATGLVIPSPTEPSKKIEMYSPAFYAACTAGGIFSCGLTHMAVTPLDLVKCNMQIDPTKYKSISSGFGILFKEQGVRGFFKGWVPTLLGYSGQGACKFGFYEFFKKYYSDLAGPEFTAKYKTLIYLAGSASAEVIADVALCPFEAVKVRVQTQPGFARGLSDGLPKFVKSEGALGLYKGIVPLWGRQIPYTMMKFASFEAIVENIYKYAIPTPKDECSKSLQLGVSFAGGYVAGVFCAIVSHPADNLVSFLNNAKGATVGDAVKKIGVLGLFTRGLPLRIVMIGTLTGAQWGIYDAFKVFVGLPTTGGVTPPPAAAAAAGAASAPSTFSQPPPGFVVFAEVINSFIKMQNEEGQITELYIPRKCSATNRLITSKDHASVQINIGHLDENGIYTGQFSTFALCGYVRAQGDADSGLDRLWQKKKAEVKQQ